MKGIPGKHLIGISAFLALVACACGADKDAPGIDVDQVYQAKSRILRRLSELVEVQVRDEG